MARLILIGMPLLAMSGCAGLNLQGDGRPVGEWQKIEADSLTLRVEYADLGVQPQQVQRQKLDHRGGYIEAIDFGGTSAPNPSGYFVFQSTGGLGRAFVDTGQTPADRARALLGEKLDGLEDTGTVRNRYGDVAYQRLSHSDGLSCVLVEQFPNRSAGGGDVLLGGGTALGTSRVTALFCLPDRSDLSQDAIRQIAQSYRVPN